MTKRSSDAAFATSMSKAQTLAQTLREQAAQNVALAHIADINSQIQNAYAQRSAMVENTRQCSRRWSFVINNPLSVEIPTKWKEQSEFICWQLERGATRHLQGYIVLKANPNNKNGRTLAWMKKMFHATAHFEPCKGSHDQNVAYCTKEETREQGPWTYGAWSDTEGPSRGGKASSSKITAVKQLIDGGATDRDIWDSNFDQMVRYHGAFAKYRMAVEDHSRDHMTKTLVLWGAPGTGKSRLAHRLSVKQFGDSVHWLTLQGGEKAWFDGYNNQRCLVIDEFNGSMMKLLYLNRLLDRYPMNVETKGSMCKFNAEMVIITSNYHPRMWYGQTSEPGGQVSADMQKGIDALLRRLNGANGAIIEMTTPFVPDDDETDFKSIVDEMIIAAEQPTPPSTPSQDDDLDWNLETGDGILARLNRRPAIDLTADNEELSDDEEQAAALDRTPEDAWCDESRFPTYIQPETEAEEEAAIIAAIRESERAQPPAKLRKYSLSRVLRSALRRSPTASLSRATLGLT